MTLPQIFRAFDDSNYRLLWLGNFIAATARGLLLTILSWYVLMETDSPWFVGLVGFSWMAPMFVLGLIGGVLADTSARKKVLVGTQTAGLVAVTLMTVLLAKDVTQFWYAYLLMSVVGIGEALDMATRRSLVHDFLGSQGVTNAVALDSVGMGVSFMIGPAAAGVLIAIFGVGASHTVVAGLYVASLALVWRLSINPPARPDQTTVSLITELVEGIRYVAGTPALMAMVLITVIMNLLLFPYIYMVPVVAKDVLGVGPALMGLLQAMPGLGALIGSVFIASLANVTHHGRLFVAGTVTAFVGLLLFSLSSTYVVSIGLMLMIGLGLAGFISMQTLIAMLVARYDMRGKALGVVTLAIGVGPFGALIVGAVADQTGPSLALFLNVAIGLPLVGLVVLTMPTLRLRTLSDTVA